MIDSATEAPGRGPVRSRRPLLNTAALLTALALVLCACAEEALPERRLTVDDCLTNVEIDRLDAALQRCDRVVAAFPREPQPLNERFLLHSLQGKEQAACRDIRRAAELVRRLPPRRLDPLLLHQLHLRQTSCQDQPHAAATPDGSLGGIFAPEPAAAPASAPTGPTPSGG